jgi:hypothetical protein
VEVSVAEVICKQIGDSDEFTGRLEAVHAVEVRPRVSGYLQSVHFKEGEIVRQGDLLFQIDPRPFQAEVSDFFIKRPIFAAVISIIIFVIGAIAYFRLPLSEYPEVVPPTVVVRTTYPGANPTVIADTVASTLEQQINGVEGMLYMFSQATPDGLMTSFARTGNR